MLSTAGLEFLSLTELKAYSFSGDLFDDLGEMLLHVLGLACLKSPCTSIRGSLTTGFSAPYYQSFSAALGPFCPSLRHESDLGTANTHILLPKQLFNQR